MTPAHAFLADLKNEFQNLSSELAEPMGQGQ